VYEETLTGRTHDTSVQKLPVTMKLWLQFNVMPWTSVGVDTVQRHAQTGRLMTHQYKKLPVTMKMWLQFNVMPWTSLDVDTV